MRERELPRASDRIGSDRPLLPEIEPTARGGRVGPRPLADPPRPASVLARVEQDIAQGAVHLARRSQQHRVIAAIQDRPRSLEHAVRSASQAGAHALHAGRERMLAGGLDDQVHVVVHE